MGGGRVGVAEECRPGRGRTPHRDRCAPRPAQQRRRDPAARLRRLPDPARGDRGRRPGPRSRSATGTSTPRRCTATRRASARPSAPSGLARDEVFVTSKLNNTLPRARRRAAGVRPDAGRRSASTTSTCSSSTGRCPRSATTSRPGRRWRRSTARGRARAIGVSNFQPHHLRRLLGGRRGGPGGEPDRGAPLPGPGRACGRSTPSTGSSPRPGRRSRGARCSTTR